MEQGTRARLVPLRLLGALPLRNQLGQVEVGRDETNMPVSFEDANGRVGGQLGHHVRLLHGGNEMVLIGCQEQRGHVQGWKAVAYVVLHKNLKTVDVPALCGRRREFDLENYNVKII